MDDLINALHRLPDSAPRRAETSRSPSPETGASTAWPTDSASNRLSAPSA
jgi:hypothetical protein